MRRRARRACAPQPAAALLTVSLLWYGGILREAFEHVVLWPLQYYKQAGGCNDALRQTEPAQTAAIEWTPQFVIALLRVLFVLAVPIVASISSMLMWCRGLRGPRATLALLGFGLLWLVFWRSRTDGVHLFFLAPVFLYLLVQHVDWERDRRSVSFARVWLALAVLFMVRWPVHWLDEPPSLSAVRSVDSEWRAHGVPNLIAELPAVSANGLPVLYISDRGSALYFYWSPLPPPVDLLLRPASCYNSPQEFLAIADFAQVHEVPYVVIAEEWADLWMRDPSPIRDVLREQYRRAFDISWGPAYCRIGAMMPQTREMICDLSPPVPRMPAAPAS